MFSEQVTSIFTQDDFTEIAANLTLDTVLNDDTFVYDSTTRTVHVKKASTTVSAGFRYPIENIYNGDIVEIEFEYKYVSGTQASFLWYDGTVLGKMQPTTAPNEWEKIKITFVAPKDFVGYELNNYLEFGAFATNTVGEYYLRNLSFKIKSQRNRVYVIDSGYNENGHWIKYSDGYMLCWGTREFASVAVTLPAGTSAYYAPYSQAVLGNFPKIFAEVPTFNITCYCENDYAWTTAINKPTAQVMPKLNTFRFASGTISNVTFNWTAYGKWRA